jgi:hypothetical protein
VVLKAPAQSGRPPDPTSRAARSPPAAQDGTRDDLVCDLSGLVALQPSSRSHAEMSMTSGVGSRNDDATLPGWVLQVVIDPLPVGSGQRPLRVQVLPSKATQPPCLLPRVKPPGSRQSGRSGSHGRTPPDSSRAGTGAGSRPIAHGRTFQCPRCGRRWCEWPQGASSHVLRFARAVPKLPRW